MKRDYPRDSTSGSQWQSVTAFAFGVIFLTIILVISIWIPNPTDWQLFIFRVVLSVAAAGIGAVLPGLLTVHVSASLRASGAVALFLIVFLFNPPKLIRSVQENTQSAGPAQSKNDQKTSASNEHTAAVSSAPRTETPHPSAKRANHSKLAPPKQIFDLNWAFGNWYTSWDLHSTGSVDHWDKYVNITQPNVNESTATGSIRLMRVIKRDDPESYYNGTVEEECEWDYDAVFSKADENTIKFKAQLSYRRPSCKVPNVIGLDPSIEGTLIRFTKDSIHEQGTAHANLRRSN